MSYPAYMQAFSIIHGPRRKRVRGSLGRAKVRHGAKTGTHLPFAALLKWEFQSKGDPKHNPNRKPQTLLTP